MCIRDSICGEAGSNYVVGLKSIDKTIKEANRAVEKVVKKTRQAKRNLKRRRDEKEEEIDGQYGAGMFSR